MSELTLLIPANKEAESLPIFLKELKKYNYKKLVVLQSEDKETIESISDFQDVEICVQEKRGYGSALIEGIKKLIPIFLYNKCRWIYESKISRGNVESL